MEYAPLFSLFMGYTNSCKVNKTKNLAGEKKESKIQSVSPAKLRKREQNTERTATAYWH